MSYIFGGNTGLAYGDAQKQRKMAQQLRKKPPENPALTGLNSGLDAIGDAITDRKDAWKAYDAGTGEKPGDSFLGGMFDGWRNKGEGTPLRSLLDQSPDSTVQASRTAPAASTDVAYNYTGDGFDPRFDKSLSSFIGAAPGPISITSGYRTPKRSGQLQVNKLRRLGHNKIADEYELALGDTNESAIAAANGGWNDRMRGLGITTWIASPGRSNHNSGLAADLKYASPEVKAWAHENAKKYGLDFRMGHEPWHIELLPNGEPIAVPDNRG